MALSTDLKYCIIDYSLTDELVAMKVRTAKNIGTIWVIVLLLASTFVIIVNNSYAETTEEPSSISSTDSTSSDEVSTASGSNRFVVWSDNSPGNYEILFRRSTDNGATWKPIVNLSNNPGRSNDEQIAVYGSNVYVVWAQANAQGNLVNIFFRHSIDSGATWKPFVNLSNNPGESGNPHNGAFVTGSGIAVSGPNVYVVWQDSTPGKYDILSRRSTDNGATWKSVNNLSNNAGDSTDPQIAL